MKLNTIAIVGGGTAGCISALVLKRRFPSLDIRIIESEKIGIVGVGEGTTEQWEDFVEYVGLDHKEIIREWGATFKMGIRYDNWDDEPFMQALYSKYGDINGYYAAYAHLISNNRPNRELQPEWVWDNECPHGDIPTIQYHFDTFKLNKFLHTKCKERGIDIVIDDLTQVKYHRNGNISSVVSETDKYYADFFIDCSGFRRFLSKNILWKSYSKYLPLNSAIAFQTEEMEEYNMWTKATAHSSGWGWTIPVQGKTGNGYVYSDNFISKEEAHEEMENYLGRKIEDVKHFKFDAGRLEKFWNKNCVSIGLSSNFVEPLEASSIGSAIYQSFILLAMLPSYDYKRYNEITINMFDNIVDFIVAHYLVRREDTPFWKMIKNNLKIPDSLQHNLDTWKYRMPHTTDIHIPWAMFYSNHYIPILYGLKWFDVNTIAEEYKMFPDVGIDLMRLQCYDRDLPKVGHKQSIENIKL